MDNNTLPTALSQFPNIDARKLSLLESRCSGRNPSDDSDSNPPSVFIPIDHKSRTESPRSPRSLVSPRALASPRGDGGSAMKRKLLQFGDEHPQKKDRKITDYLKATTIETQTELQSQHIERILSDREDVENEAIRQVRLENQKLQREKNSLKEQVDLQSKVLIKRDESLNKCLEVNKTLLVEKCVLEKKSARQRSMEDRLRLGQYIGIGKEEIWKAGYAFSEIDLQLNAISHQKEEVDQQKKALSKQKPRDLKAEYYNRAERYLNSPCTSPFRSHSFAPSLLRNRDFFLHFSSHSFIILCSKDASEEVILEFFGKQSMLDLRIKGLKREENELRAAKDKLHNELLVHRKETKRIFDEDRSKYQDNEILKDRYLFLHLLGKGGFSEVHKAFDLREMRYVAVKIHQVSEDMDKTKKENFLRHAIREYNIHKSLNHSKIVKFYDVFELNNSFATVMEYCEGNDLDFYLKQHGAIPEREARGIIIQIVSALKYLNELDTPVIHFDLKGCFRVDQAILESALPANVLLGPGNIFGEIKITDFGLSKKMEEENEMELTSQGAGTYWYLPPECFYQNSKISSKVDVWAVGVLFFQMLTGQRPFGHNQTQRDILHQSTILLATEVNFPPKPTINQEAKRFICRCLTHNKEDRPDVKELAMDDYLQHAGLLKLKGGFNVDVGENSNQG